MLARLIIAFVLNIADYLFTLYFVHLYGLEVEANPIGRWLLEKPWRGIVFKVFGIAALLAVLYVFRSHTIAVIGSWIVLVVYAALVLCHILILVITRRIGHG